MKHLLTGVAMAAALAIAAPAWAQNAPPSAPPAAAPPAAAPTHSTPARAHQVRPSVKRHMHHVVHRRSAGDAMTEQLNQQELQRITSGGAAPSPAPAPMPMAMPPGGNNPTSGASGPFAPGGTAPPPPAK